MESGRAGRRPPTSRSRRSTRIRQSRRGGRGSIRWRAPIAFAGAALVAKDDRALFQSAYGEASRPKHVPNRVDTKFNLGSLNKIFRKLAIAQAGRAGQGEARRSHRTLPARLPQECGEPSDGATAARSSRRHRRRLWGRLRPHRSIEAASACRTGSRCSATCRWRSSPARRSATRTAATCCSAPSSSASRARTTSTTCGVTSIVRSG